MGGGPAGLSAALVLGRSRRRTVLYDAGSPRNAPASAAHNLYTRDGTAPAELNAIARDQLTPYPSVTVRDVGVTAVQRTDAGFLLRDADGNEVHADQVILATGVVDVLPDVPGVRELWGTGVFHCPYCHGWEVRGQPFVVLAQGPAALHVGPLLRGWSDDVQVCPVEGYTPTAEERATLEATGVRWGPAVVGLEGAPDGTVATVAYADGTRGGPAAVFTTAPVRQRAPFAEQLGCRVHGEGMFAGRVAVEAFGATGVPGVWVVGDAAEGMPQVVSAAHQGTTAGAMLNNALLQAGRLPQVQ